MADKWLGGVRPGQADVTIAAFFRATADNTELTGLTATDITASYWRQGGSRVAITVSDLTAIDDAHSDGGFKEVDATNMPGLYRFDVPDAAYVAGADWVVVTLTTANGFAFNERFNITAKVENLVWEPRVSYLQFVNKYGHVGTDTGQDTLEYPHDVCTDGTYLYVADTYNHRVVKRLASDMSYVSEIGSQGSGNDQFDVIFGLCTDGTYIYVSDWLNARIVKRLCSDLSYVAQIGSQGSGQDQFYRPMKSYTNGTHLFILDTGNNRIKKHLCSDLSYVTMIGSGGNGQDQFASPMGITGDGTNLYIGDSGNDRIQVRLMSDLSYVRDSGTLSLGTTDDVHYWNGFLFLSWVIGNQVKILDPTSFSIIGSYGSLGSADNQFNQPRGIDSGGGYLYIVEQSGGRVTKRIPLITALQADIVSVYGKSLESGELALRLASLSTVTPVVSDLVDAPNVTAIAAINSAVAKDSDMQAVKGQTDQLGFNGGSVNAYTTNPVDVSGQSISDIRNGLVQGGDLSPVSDKVESLYIRGFVEKQAPYLRLSLITTALIPLPSGAQIQLYASDSIYGDDWNYDLGYIDENGLWVDGPSQGTIGGWVYPLIRNSDTDFLTTPCVVELQESFNGVTWIPVQQYNLLGMDNTTWRRRGYLRYDGTINYPTNKGPNNTPIPAPVGLTLPQIEGSTVLAKQEKLDRVEEWMQSVHGRDFLNLFDVGGFANFIGSIDFEVYEWHPDTAFTLLGSFVSGVWTPNGGYTFPVSGHRSVLAINAVPDIPADTTVSFDAVYDYNGSPITRPLVVDLSVPAGRYGGYYFPTRQGQLAQEQAGVRGQTSIVGDANLVSINSISVTDISDFADAILDEPQSAHQTVGSIGANIGKPQYTTDVGCTLSAVQVISGPASDGMFLGQILTMLPGDPTMGAGQSRRITGYTASTRIFTVDPPFSIAPTSGLVMRIEPFVSPGTVEKNITNITYNPDGTINVITHQDSTTITFAYTGGKITSVVYG